jgi:hypothetical protein
MEVEHKSAPEQEKRGRKLIQTNPLHYRGQLLAKRKPISICAVLLEFPFHCYPYLRPLISKSRHNGGTASVLD